MQAVLNIPSTIALPSYEYTECADISFDSFVLVRCIGYGAYGQVWLCEKKDSKILYAIKILKKAQLVRPSILNRTIRERELLEIVDSPFVVKLRFCFQDSENIYFVTDYYSGGDFFALVEQQPYNRLSEANAKLYLAEVVIALNDLHMRNVVYRDLKMENILMTNSGHIILTDLGMSRLLSAGQRSMSILGTPQYMSPEMVNRRGHDKDTDFWSLGVLAYQMMVGVVPFNGNSVETIFSRISRQPVIQPPMLSMHARNLISSLLEKNPNDRLGHEGIESLTSHSFFQGIDWMSMKSRLTPLPLTTAFSRLTLLKTPEQTAHIPSIFDRFSPYVDGTNRYLQKQLIKQILLSWMKYEMDSDLLYKMRSDLSGVVPCRGIWGQERRTERSFPTSGYFQYNTREELVTHLINEKLLFPAIPTCLSQMSASIEDKSVLFEGDRCVCQWRIWGRNQADAFICIHGSISASITADNMIHQLDITTSASPILLFSSLVQQPSNINSGVMMQNPCDILHCIIQTLEHPTAKMFDEIMNSSAIQLYQSFQIQIEKRRYQCVSILRLEQLVSVICDALRNRCVCTNTHSFLQAPPNSVPFVLSGVHTNTLFDLVPMNDIAHIYGYLSINNGHLTGLLRLDALCDFSALEDLVKVISVDTDAVLNNLMNSLVYDGEIEKACWLEMCHGLRKCDHMAIMVSVKQLAKQWYLKKTIDSIECIYECVQVKLSIENVEELLGCDDGLLPSTNLIQKKLFILLLSVGIQEYLAHEVIRSN